MNVSRTPAKRKPSFYLILATVVLLAAATLRVVALREAPPGPRFDEAFDALMARRVMNGERPLYFPENFGEEPLLQYLQAAALAAFGWSDVALRFPSVALGLVEVAAVYALGCRAWNRRAGLAAAALCAVSFWPVFFSRLGIRVIALPAIAAAAILMLWHMQAAKGRGLAAAGAAGVLLGLAMYTYTAARALPILIVCAGIYLALFNRAALRRHAEGWILLVVLAALIAAPLVHYLATHPQAEPRVGQVSGPLDALREGDLASLRDYALAAIGMFAVRGDPEWLYNVPGRPVFDPVTAFALVAGIVVALRRCISLPGGRQESHTAFMLLWLGAGLLPVMLSWPPASNSHAILAQPAVFVLAGVGLETILSRASRISSFPATLLGLAVIALNGGLTARDYFGVWNTSDQTRWEHQATVTAIGRYADAHPELRDMAFAGTAVDYYNPWMKVGISLTSRRTDARWFNPARALVWNPSGPMTYLIPFRDPNPVTFNQIIQAMFFDAARTMLDARLADGRPLFTRYEMPDASALHAQAISCGTPAYDLGQWVLIGYEARPAEARPGDTIRVLTYWRVARADSSPLVLFTHLMGPDGKLITQEDRLDVAPETLHAGDEFLQTHRVALAGDAPPGTYRVGIGLYSPVTQVRLPVAGSDHVEFSLVVR